MWAALWASPFFLVLGVLDSKVLGVSGSVFPQLVVPPPSDSSFFKVESMLIGFPFHSIFLLLFLCFFISCFFILFFVVPFFYSNLPSLFFFLFIGVIRYFDGIFVLFCTKIIKKRLGFLCGGLWWCPEGGMDINLIYSHPPWWGMENSKWEGEKKRNQFDIYIATD